MAQSKQEILTYLQKRVRHDKKEIQVPKNDNDGNLNKLSHVWNRMKPKANQRRKIFCMQ